MVEPPLFGLQRSNYQCIPIVVILQQSVPILFDKCAVEVLFFPDLISLNTKLELASKSRMLRLNQL